MTSKNSKRKSTAPIKKVIAIEEIEKEEESTDEVFTIFFRLCFFFFFNSMCFSFLFYRKIY